MSGPRLIHGDAVAAMAGLPAASVDLIYMDPPFATGADWSGPAGSFRDTWTWTAATEAARAALGEPGRFIAAMPSPPAMKAYLVFMVPVLVECRRVLRQTGCLWLHCDDHAHAELRLMLELVFGARLFMGELIWRRSTGSVTKRGYSRVHDTIIRTAGGRAHLTIARRFATDVLTKALGENATLGVRLTATARERVGYPTQKPVGLLMPLIAASSFRGQTVLDPMCGSGSALVAADRLGRRVIGIDASADAIAASRKRFGADLPLFGGLAA
jgi:site-specific DNA-methyltransferase (adenine-specific)